jgi:predicted amidohydrolase
MGRRGELIKEEAMPLWNVAAAQYGARPGDLQANISHHLQFIHQAAAEKIDLLIFPELSLTGFQPEQHISLALHFSDERLTPLQDAAVEFQMTIVVGMLLLCDECVSIGSVGFLPDGSRVSCCKPKSCSDNVVHEQHTPLVGKHNRSVAMGHCGASNEEIWPRTAAALGADLYATGTFVNEANCQHDEMYLQRWAHKYNLPVLFANHAFSTGPHRTAGRSACWDSLGQLVVRADHGELLAVGRRDEKGWHGEIIPLR